MNKDLKDPNVPNEIREYVYTYIKGRKVKVGVILGIKHSDHEVFVTWSKYNTDLERKPFNPELAVDIAQARYFHWATGCETHSKIPVSMQRQMDHFLERCKYQYEGYEVHLFGTYAERTRNRVAKLEINIFFNEPV